MFGTVKAKVNFICVGVGNHAIKTSKVPVSIATASRHRVAMQSSSDGVISGEWDATWSLATYNDVLTYFKSAKSASRSSKPSESGEGMVFRRSAGGVISGEWDATWSLATYDDVLTYFNSKMLKDSVGPSTQLADIMQKRVYACHPEDDIADLKETSIFDQISGMPVVDADGVLVGVVTQGDMGKPGGKVYEIMSAPPVAARASDPVTAAACLMLKFKVHHIPVVDSHKHCVGLVTRSDVFTALAEGSANETFNVDM